MSLVRRFLKCIWVHPNHRLGYVQFQRKHVEKCFLPLHAYCVHSKKNTAWVDLLFMALMFLLVPALPTTHLTSSCTFTVCSLLGNISTGGGKFALFLWETDSQQQDPQDYVKKLFEEEIQDQNDNTAWFLWPLCLICCIIMPAADYKSKNSPDSWKAFNLK